MARRKREGEEIKAKEAERRRVRGDEKRGSGGEVEFLLKECQRTERRVGEEIRLEVRS